MNHKLIYDSIISKAKSENRKKGDGIYYENHHILPKCLGGSNLKENLVLLTAKEHFICHKLLVEIYPGNKGVIKAIWMMCNKVSPNGNRIYIVSSREYFVARMLFVESISGENNSRFGEAPWNLGVPCSEEIKNRIRCKLKGTFRSKDSISKQLETNKIKFPNGENYKFWKGKLMPKEDVEKRRESNKNQKRSEEFCKNLSESRKGEGNPAFGVKPWNSGVPWDDSAIDKLKESWESREKVKCPYCDKVGHQNGMARYHFDNCKHKIKEA